LAERAISKSKQAYLPAVKLPPEALEALF